MAVQEVALITIDCRELTQDEQLALASAISDSLQDRAFALVKGDDIVIDDLSEVAANTEELANLVLGFISRRKESGYYSVEKDGDRLTVHSETGFGERVKKTANRVPSNAFQCPACGLVLPDQGTYDNHLRIHDLVRGIS